MKKILITFFLIIGFSFGYTINELKLEAKIFEKVSVYLLSKKPVKVYILDNDLKLIVKYSPYLQKVDDPKKADMIITSKKLPTELIALNKIVIGTKYFLLKEKYVTGAIFWHKGRPNIILLRDRLKAHKIKPPKALEKYVEDRIW